MRRIDKVCEAASEYGRRSAENMQLCEGAGRRIIEAFDKYLNPDGDTVVGVPPDGDWDPNLGDYDSGAFSFSGDQLLKVDDIYMGLAVRVFERRDKGCFWIRIPIGLRKQADQIGILVDGPDPKLWIPIEFKDSDLEKVCAHLFEFVLQKFQSPVNYFVQGRNITIGFVPR